MKPQIPMLMLLLAAVAIFPLRAEDVLQLANGQVGAAYQFKIPTDGGLAPLHWAVKSGNLPPGIKLQDGVIFGTPTQALAIPYQFGVEVSDSSQPAQDYSQVFSILIKAPPLKMVLNAKPLKIITAASSLPPDAAPELPPSISLSTQTKEPAAPNPAAQAAPPAAEPIASTKVAASHPCMRGAEEFCINLPVVNASHVTGKGTKPGNKIILKLNGKPSEPVNVQADNSFDVHLTTPLKSSDLMEIDEVAAQGGTTTAEPPVLSMDQPVDGATQVTGRGGLPGESISLKVPGRAIASPVPIADDGSFTIPANPPLKQYEVVTIDEGITGAGGAPVATIGPISVTVMVCDARVPVPPCIDQPFAGATEISGKVASNKTLRGVTYAKVTAIAVNHLPISNPNIDSDGTKNGSFSISGLSALSPYDTVTVTQDATPPLSQPQLTVGVVAKSKFNYMAPYGQALVGVDVSAASSVSPGATFLGMTLADIPLWSNVNMKKPNSGHVWLSGQLSLKGMAQPGTVSGAASSGYYASAANATPDKIVQSVDASLHLGVQLYGWHNKIGTFDVSGPTTNPDKKSATYTTLSIIFGGGAVTPLSFSQSSPQVFEATPLILKNETPVAPTTTFAPSCSANPTQTPTCFVIFVPSDRTHFYRAFDVGLRLKLYGIDNTDNELRFPAILDLTLGQNEYVTGGNFHGAVLHLGGSFPIPRVDAFYIFGSIDMGLSNVNGGGPQLQLIPAPVTTGLTAASPSVYTISTGQPNRDRYQFGFGVDVFHLFSSKLKAKTSGQPAS